VEDAVTKCLLQPDIINPNENYAAQKQAGFHSGIPATTLIWNPSPFCQVQCWILPRGKLLEVPAVSEMDASRFYPGAI
jgi:hypothetical protein